MVLSRYDLGQIESVTEFRRGSRRRPKVGIVCDRGKYLLKRRPRSEAATQRVANAHRLQDHLLAAGLPLPKLVACTPGGQQTFLRGPYVYELFDYVRGQSYSGTGDETRSSGEALGQFHKAVRDFDGQGMPSRGDYHDANPVRTALSSISNTMGSHDSAVGLESELIETTGELLNTYESCCEVVDVIGLRGWPQVMIHSDWHPGNMLFRHHEVVAVIDFDSARQAQKVIDLANGILQFSMLSSKHVEDWPDELDERRARLFLEGYLGLETITKEEQACIPHLMIEALIAESVLPIAATGSFGRYHGFRFMKMVCRKSAWLARNAERLAENVVAASSS